MAWPPELELAFEARVLVDRSIDVGQTPQDRRRIIPITGAALVGVGGAHSGVGEAAGVFVEGGDVGGPDVPVEQAQLEVALQGGVLGAAVQVGQLGRVGDQV